MIVKLSDGTYAVRNDIYIVEFLDTDGWIEDGRFNDFDQAIVHAGTRTYGLPWRIITVVARSSVVEESICRK